MPLTLPNLDDRRFEDLVNEARTLIPSYAPEWTDHNVADPGITLIEMFAYLTEIMLYRLNRVTDENTLRFVKLMRGPEWQRDPSKTLAEEVRGAVLELRERERAVTADDYEQLALASAPNEIARACCLPGLGLDPKARSKALIDREGHVTVLVVPAAPSTQADATPEPSADLLERVSVYLEPRRLLTMRVHVVGPRYVPLGVRMEIVPRSDMLEDRVRNDALSALTRFLHPLTGGLDGRGWPFGRPVYVSEIYDLLDRLPSVDFVQKAKQGKPPFDELTGVEAERLERNADGDLIAVRLARDELVAATIEPNALVIL